MLVTRDHMCVSEQHPVAVSLQFANGTQCVCLIIVIMPLLQVFVYCHLEAESVVLHELKRKGGGGVCEAESAGREIH